MQRRQFLQSSSILPALAALQGDVRGVVQDRREELITARTQDDLVHTALLVAPAVRPNPIAVIWVHGASGNFYVPSYVEIARATASRGYPFLSLHGLAQRTSGRLPTCSACAISLHARKRDRLGWIRRSSRGLTISTRASQHESQTRW